jgi:uncharacterized membrane protein YgdD (TMEM256/DUF423 family)
MQKGNFWIFLGCVSGLLSVMMGAFGAHAVKAKISAEMLSVYQTGAQYQMYHALALLALGLWMSTHPTAHSSVAGWAFTLGSVIFSGSLYALSLSGVRGLGAITPVGGLLFMIGWIAFGLSVFKQS